MSQVKKFYTLNIKDLMDFRAFQPSNIEFLQNAINIGVRFVKDDESKFLIEDINKEKEEVVIFGKYFLFKKNFETKSDLHLELNRMLIAIISENIDILEKMEDKSNDKAKSLRLEIVNLTDLNENMEGYIKEIDVESKEKELKEFLNSKSLYVFNEFRDNIDTLNFQQFDISFYQPNKKQETINMLFLNDETELRASYLLREANQIKIDDLLEGFHMGQNVIFSSSKEKIQKHGLSRISKKIEELAAIKRQMEMQK